MPKSKNKQTQLFPKLIAMFLLGFIGLTGVVFASQFTTLNANTRSRAAVLSEAVARFSITSDTGIANQDGSTFTTGQDKMWLGTGGDVSQSYLGMHFSGANIPAGSIIKSASLEFTADGGWINMGVTFFGDTTGKGLFTQTDRPSIRTLTTASSAYNDDVKWDAGKTYTYDVTRPVQEMVGARAKSSLVVIAKGSGSKYGRKTVFGKPSTGKSPVLTVVYTTNMAGGPTPTAVPVRTATPKPTAMPSSMPGMTMSPNPTALPGGTGGGVSGGTDSPEMTMWSYTGKNKPNPKYDKCDDGTDIVAAHQKFSVIGPDGKRYPTWHAPVVTNPITGIGKCYFGHEHGRNPTGYQFYDEVRKNFAYDANKNGIIDPNELAVAGIPFGYINNAVDTYFATHSSSSMFMRHEDHVGHKIEYANGEGDIGTGTDPFDSRLTGGLVVPVKSTVAGRKWDQSGVRCYHFDKIHQGVSSPDALSNNMHEIIMHEKCISTRAGTPDSTTLLSGMMTFGAPGEFTEFCNDNRTTIVPVGKNADTMNLPGSRSDGTRNIITRRCIERTVLVPAGQFSSFPYEEWDGTLRVVKPNGTEVAANNGSWEVLDAIRYYNPASPTMISYNSDACYENLNGRTARGGTCDFMTKYGTIKDITWDDRRSAYQGRSRGQYVNYHRINNAGGSEVWYTDPFGRNAQTTPFPGSIKQIVSTVNLAPIANTDPRIVQRDNDSGSGTVHAPN